MDNSNGVLKQVQAAIERAAPRNGQHPPISLSYCAGTVELAGEVADIAVKKLALQAAAGVSGVSAVSDRLRVDAGPPQGDGATRDAVCTVLLGAIDFRNCSLHVRVKGRREILRDAGSEAAGSIEVAVVDGVVVLAGRVLSLSHKRLAGVLAWWSPGCRDVVNELAVMPAEEDNDDEIVDALQLVFETDPALHGARIAIASRDRVVTLEGVVANAGDRRRAELDAWYLDSVAGVVNRLEVR